MATVEIFQTKIYPEQLNKYLFIVVYQSHQTKAHKTTQYSYFKRVFKASNKNGSPPKHFNAFLMVEVT